MNGLPYYKAYPRDFLEGTVGMTFEAKAAYRLVLDLIYMHGGYLPDDKRYICGQLGCNPWKWGKLRAALIEAGKIQPEGDFLTNSRAFLVLKDAEKFQRKQSENASGPRKNKGLAKPRLNHTESDTEREDSEANASAADAPRDPASIIFNEGLRLLTGKGVAEPKARSMLGKWRRDHGDAALVAALGNAQREGAIDPVAFVSGCFRANGQRKERASGQLTRKMEMARGLRDRREGAGGMDCGEGGELPLALLPPRVAGGS